MEQNILEFYTQMTRNTDPKDLAYLYHGLPDDLESLCNLIKCQLIHPTMVKKYKYSLPAGVKNEDDDFRSVYQMLTALLERNANGIIEERENNEKLILSCRFHALLLASILRSKNIPVRLRVGFAGYLSKESGKYIDHWVCEVWIESRNSWQMVDPDLEIIDLENEDFLLSGEAWLLARDKNINPGLFGVKKSWGLFYIRNNLCHDLQILLGNEVKYWDYSPICQKNINKLDFDELQLLDDIALFLIEPDSNIEQIRAVFAANPSLHVNQ